ncbi:MAG: ABC transporter permease [Caldicoprobacterales bacterium]|nr:ABC transporter permease [Clostridia bacterium]MDI9511722.1 ABC transporter permease [Bacillota bacterium]NLH59165.1 ABC transporter permease [Clostridiales bacterium]
MKAKAKSLKKNAPAIPILVWIGFLVGVPLIFVVVLSFLSRDNLGNIVFKFSLDNYKRMFDPIYLRVFANSFLLAILTGFITLIIGYPVAYFTTRLKAKKRSFVTALIVLPFWVSSLLRTYGWVILLGKTGLINNVLVGLNIIDQPLNMMYKFSTTLIGTAYMLIPFMIIAVYNSVDKLDRSLLEASYDLGAGKWKTFFNITLPLTIPGISGGFTLVFIPSLGMFFVSDLLGGGRTVFLGNLINTQVTRGRNRPLAAAFSVGMIVLVVLVLLIYNRVTKNKGRELF